MAQPQQENKPAVEDDEFEEFSMDGKCLCSVFCASECNIVKPQSQEAPNLADWTEQQEDAQNAALWEVDWDDDGLDDEFSRSLREQLSKPVPKQGAS